MAVPATGGTHYLMYSYAPKLFIFNGFLQSLIGLDAYGDLTGDALGGTLFRAGHGNAKAIVPLSDTGSWSRYSVGGPESTLEYHALLRTSSASSAAAKGPGLLRPRGGASRSTWCSARASQHKRGLAPFTSADAAAR